MWHKVSAQKCTHGEQNTSVMRIQFSRSSSIISVGFLQHEVFSGVLNSPWRTEVFSGELKGVFVLDFTLWDEGSEIAWHCTNAVRANPAELATVEVLFTNLVHRLCFLVGSQLQRPFSRSTITKSHSVKRSQYDCMSGILAHSTIFS